MPAEEEILNNTILAGEREFVAGATAEAAAVERLGLASETAGRRFEGTARRGFLMNQALFTTRRVAYAGTLGLLAAGAAALKLGWDFNSAMQQARVALRPVFSDQQALTDELNYLFNFAKYTPLQFKDITIAFRQMYGAFQPLGISIGTTNETLQSIVDALAFVGRESPGALNRVSVALQHMAYQGRLTGMTTLQLARDGLPIYAALQKELGLTADQLHHIGQLGIPVEVALGAINRYIRETPGYAGAARRQALHSLHGLVTTIRDTLSQVFGVLEKGLFDRIQHGLERMLNTLDDVSVAIQNDGADMEGVMKILDQHITPGSGNFLRFWHQLRGTIHELWGTISGLTGALTHNSLVWGTVYGILVLIHAILWGTHINAQLLGNVIGIMLPLWVAWHVYLKLTAFWLGIVRAEEAILTKTTKELTFVQFLLAVATGRYMLMERLAAFTTAAYAAAQTWLNVTLSRGTLLILASAAAIVWNRIVTGAAAVATWAWVAAMWGLDAAMAVFDLLNPLVWVGLLVAALVILYFRWQWFHDLVDRTWHWIDSHWLLLTPTFLGPFLIIYKIIQHLNELKAAVEDTVNWIIKQWNRIPGHHGIAGIAGALARHVFSSPLGPVGALIPGLAGGGTVMTGGFTWVGEHGRELLALPAGATVTPGTELHSASYPILRGRGLSDGRPQVVQLIVDGEKLAEIVTYHQDNAEARS